jgi:thymidylate synthase (FAD)
MNENIVELIDIYGNDETIACSAWTSTSRNLTEEKRNRIPAMLKDLWTNGHETPFEKVNVHFLLTTDIASHIHILKHRISSVNAESARYKELKEDKMYLPDDWKNTRLKRDLYILNDRAPFIKGKHSWYDVLKQISYETNRIYHIALSELEQDLGRKRAKESARFFKMYNSQIQADVMMNMRSFANFQKLRNSEHAQKEIREIAQEMLALVKQDGKLKYTLEAMGL